MPTENKTTQKQQRVEHVNQVIRIIADHGRRFFYSKTVNRYASMEVDKRGKVWFVDDYSGKRIFTHETARGGRWRGFTHGGTLKDIVKQFRDYICTGEPLHPGYLGPERFDDSNIWGLRRSGHEGCARAGRRPSRFPSASRGGSMYEVKRYTFAGAAGLYVYQADFDAALAREAALQARLTVADQRVDDATDLLRRAYAVIDGGGWKDLEADIAAFLAPPTALSCIDGGKCGIGGYCDACPHTAPAVSCCGSCPAGCVEQAAKDEAKL